MLTFLAEDALILDGKQFMIWNIQISWIRAPLARKERRYVQKMHPGDEGASIHDGARHPRGRTCHNIPPPPPVNTYTTDESTIATHLHIKLVSNPHTNTGNGNHEPPNRNQDTATLLYYRALNVAVQRFNVNVTRKQKDENCLNCAVSDWWTDCQIWNIITKWRFSFTLSVKRSAVEV